MELIKFITVYSILTLSIIGYGFLFSNYFTNDHMRFAFNLEEIVEYYNLYLNIMNLWNDLLPGFIYNLKY